ncbi:MAG: hypothetical protein KJ057_00835 [Phycisphaerae bacterium]|nr:MAG: hypothetical protein F9K17_14875 [Phycisphaerae bacterium]MBE7455746.1 hypothetical protein [Planctomycetia bacterium]MCK6463382.1 hypothetical protein [Phycisphaerae bacterium]MCL4717004.1 hypothetical protein [Phycisphaerae bacterium]NUQ08148.1 hypothetical protein [Phycisphaerae bacterium]
MNTQHVGRFVCALAFAVALCAACGCATTRSTTEVSHSRHETEPEMTNQGEMQSEGEMVSPGTMIVD